MIRMRHVVLTVAAASVLLCGALPALAAGPIWTSDQIAGVPNGIPSAVSCTSALSCVMVGATRRHGFAEAWDGTGWAQIGAPTPPSLPVLDGVSCTSSTACVAVGGAGCKGPVALRFDGQVWSSTTVAPPPRADRCDPLTAISCSGSICVAVGGAQDVGYAERFDGHRWTALTLPKVKGTQLSGVSCVTSSWCLLSGDWDGGSLLETMHGSTFTTRLGHENLGQGEHGNSAYIDTLSVSCTSTTACAAAGGDINDSTYLLLATFNGHAWTTRHEQGMDTPVATGVSCASADFCMALDDDGTDEFQWNGTKWSQHPISPPDINDDPSSSNGFSALACTTGPFCAAVGTTGGSGLIADHSE